MSDQGQSPPRTVVYRSTQRRTFKACRTCRQQKARCIDAEDPPCKRCRATGRDCVFEELGISASRKRSNQASTDDEPGSKRPSGNRYHDLEKEVSQLRSLVNNFRATPHHGSLHQTRTSQPSSPSQQNLALSSPTRETQVRQSSHPSIMVEDGAASEDLTSLPLDAPITAVHAMSMKGLPPSPSSVRSHESIPSFTSAPGGSNGGGRAHLQPTTQRPNDVVSAGLVTEFEARKLFQLYMANANVFLPVFDPAVDSFEAVRQSSTFCFTVILAVALRAEERHSNSRRKGEKCFLEAQNLATQSLFASSARLETIQGMLLLSAYSDKNWFAISHAYQMSHDMGLPDILHEGMGMPDSVETLRNFSDRRLVRRTRTALILHHVEQEVASGTARPSKGSPVKEEFLRGFLHNKFLNASDMRIVANVEIVQLRGHLLRELELETSHIGSVRMRVQRIEQEISKWFNYWDPVFQGQDFNVGCFQRSSIRLQRDYAFIIVGSAIISKLSNELAAASPEDILTDELSELAEMTFERSVKILGFIAENNDYKWYLQWAPTYSALFPAFTAVLAFRLAKIRPGATDWKALETSFITVADILEDYPYQHFSLIIRDLSRLCPKASLSRGIQTRASALQSGRNPPGQRQSSALSQINADLLESSSLNSATLLSGQHDLMQIVEMEDQITPDTANGEDPTSTNCVGAGNDRTSWLSGPTPQFSFQDNGPTAEQLDMQSLLTSPDYIFDFNLFAASMQSTTDDPHLSGRI